MLCLLGGGWLAAVGRAKTAVVVAGAVVVGSCCSGAGGRSRENVCVAAIGGCHGRDEYNRDLSFIGRIGGTGNVHVGWVFPEIDTDAVAIVLVDQRLDVDDG